MSFLGKTNRKYSLDRLVFSLENYFRFSLMGFDVGRNYISLRLTVKPFEVQFFFLVQTQKVKIIRRKTFRDINGVPRILVQRGTGRRRDDLFCRVQGEVLAKNENYKVNFQNMTVSMIFNISAVGRLCIIQYYINEQRAPPKNHLAIGMLRSIVKRARPLRCHSHLYDYERTS